MKTLAALSALLLTAVFSARAAVAPAAEPVGGSNATPAAMTDAGPKVSPMVPLTVTRVLILLSLTGAVGGIAASFVKNDRLLVLPRFVEGTSGRTDEAGNITPGRPGGLDLGFLGDMLVGMVAANSIQLALAAVLDYKIDETNYIQKFMSLVALGLVAGFSGPKILEGLAKKLEGDVEKTLRETDERQQVELEEQRKEIQDAFKNLKEVTQANFAREMADAVSPDVPPEAAQAQLDVAARLVERQIERQKQPASPGDSLILAFKAYQAGDYNKAIELGEKVLEAPDAEKFRWQIHNLLGISYHWTQPDNWKPGDQSTWWDKAREHYEAAVRSTKIPSEQMLAKANLAFVHLDAQRYTDCLRTVQEVLAMESSGGNQAAELCDLARIAAAAAQISQNDGAAATTTLNQTRHLALFEYLFNGEDLNRSVITALAALSGLDADKKAFLESVAKKLGPA